MANILTSSVGKLRWINKANDDGLEIFKESAARFVSNGISSNKLSSIAEHIGISSEDLKESIIAIIRLTLNRLHLKNKGSSAVENALVVAGIEEEKRALVLELVESLAQIQSCEDLLKKSIEQATKGTYVDSQWRMDIDVAQRSSLSPEPEVNFLCQLTTSSGVQTLRMTPKMLEKLELELQKAVNAGAKAKRIRV